MVGSALAPQTERLKFLLALRPGYMTPNLAARQSAALDRISNGRLLLNIVTGGQPKELAGDGILMDHDERYQVTDEFLHIWRNLLANGHVDFRGQHLTAQKPNSVFSTACRNPTRRYGSVAPRPLESTSPPSMSTPT